MDFQRQKHLEVRSGLFGIMGSSLEQTGDVDRVVEHEFCMPDLNVNLEDMGNNIDNMGDNLEDMGNNIDVHIEADKTITLGELLGAADLVNFVLKIQEAIREERFQAGGQRILCL